mgnify:CR=1 FL=1
MTAKLKVYSVSRVRKTSSTYCDCVSTEKSLKGPGSISDGKLCTIDLVSGGFGAVILVM